MAASLTLGRRLWLSLLAPIAALAVALGFGGAVMIERIVEQVNDRLLAASARAIAGTLAVENRQLTLDLPPFALGMLENGSRDNVYYSVRSGNRLITGYPELPSLAAVVDDPNGAVFRYSRFGSVPIRVAAIAYRIPGAAQPVVVSVAETLEARGSLRQRMLLGLAGLEALLILLVLALIPFALRRGLAPLERVRSHIAARDPTDFAPLPMNDVPGELTPLVDAFNALLARLEQAGEGTRRFTADASHQMRTPLTILRTHLSVLRSAAPGSAMAATSLTDIEEATERLQRLLTQLLALARAESAAEKMVEVEEAVDLVDLARRVTAEHAPTAVRGGVDIDFVGPSNPIPVLTSSALLAEMISNIVDNAVRYTRAGGIVSVTVEANGAQVAVIVEDDGPGIPAHLREAAFTRFRRLEHDSQRPGSGLGLAIVRALGDAIGVTVALLDGRAGHGLRVELLVPRTPRFDPETIRAGDDS